ncbi:hypothetical protein SO802_026287 [Lithocarpus litseifolius]|uniref:GINS subunit domain-containing protein n=1 Tax=Lithocarpus litseifolius TaxID=425828 RepID=A0AAW2BZM4_9ROSI
MIQGRFQPVSAVSVTGRYDLIRPIRPDSGQIGSIRRKSEKKNLRHTDARAATSDVTPHVGLRYNRAETIRSLIWKVGPVLPQEIQEKLSHAEEDYFKKHAGTLRSYMSRLDLDLTVDMVPPKDPYIQIVNICTKEKPSKCQPCRISNVPFGCEEFRDGIGAKRGWVRAEESQNLM